MKRFSIILFVFIAAPWFCFPQETNTTTSVFILAGQSNMEGAADAVDLTKVDLEDLKRAQKNILLAYNGGRPKPLNITIPPDWKKKKYKLDSCFGPEIFFGIELSKKYPNQKFLFIKRTQGGTSLYGCWNPDWTKEKAKYVGELDKPKLFYELLDYSDDILSKYEKNSYKIEGMLWVQGESDSGKKWGPLPSETYYDNLKILINRVRDHYNYQNMPFMILQVGGGKVVQAMKKVSTEINSVSFIAQSKDSNSYNFLPRYGKDRDKYNAHYNYFGMKKIGVLFSEEFINKYSRK